MRERVAAARVKRLENIRHHPEVTVLVDHYEEDWTRLWWVRLDGVATVLEQGLERERALELLQAKYEQYRTEPPTGPVMAVRVARWRAGSSIGQGAPRGRPRANRARRTSR